MKIIDFERDTSVTSSEYWYPEVVNGLLRCSCGRELIQIDSNTWECSFGYPRFIMNMGKTADKKKSDKGKDDKDSHTGDIILDRFGKMMFKIKEHRK